MIDLKDFQNETINKLSLTFLELWKTEEYKIPLIFKAPTGAGKTIMMAEFLRCLDDNYQFDSDKAYIWISFGGDDSYTQSKNKLYHYFNEGTDMHLKDINSLSEGKLYKNNIFFINWSKIKGTDKESKKLRKSGGIWYWGDAIFDEYIKNTRMERDIILIIDEAHTETNTTLASEVIDLLNPRIILKVTATPKDEKEIKALAFDKKAGFVESLEKDVIESGLIKEKIVIQTEEEIKAVSETGLSEDEIMIELAYNKRLELKKYYKELNLDINPLVLIQLPSDEKDKEEVATNKREMTINYLHKKWVKDNEIAIWLSGERTNNVDEFLVKNNSEVNFMIFKVAPATWWDCPRADILVMFREINSPSFHTQIIGRIKRMPDGHHYSKEELNKAYIYTNYNKSHIQSLKEEDKQNKIPVHFTRIQKHIDRISLDTIYHHRTDFNTITPPNKWEETLHKVLDDYFKTKEEILDYSWNINVVQGKIDLTITDVNNQIIVSAEIDSFDNFVNEIKEKWKNIDYHFSWSDIERLYNLLCFQELHKQDIDEAKYNPSRSWSTFKMALNVWFCTRFWLDRSAWYKIIVNELANNNSELKKAIQKALIEFRKTYNEEVKEKEGKEIFHISIPESEVSFTNDFEELKKDDFGNDLNIKKNVYEKFFIKKIYKGSINEINFVQFLEYQDIDWWHKQDDHGRNVFAIEYFDTQEKKYRLFCPDFIVKKGKKIWILDTKNWETAKSQNTKDKSEALQNWIQSNASKYEFMIEWWILEYKYPNWRLNNKDTYVYENSSDWHNLVF